MIASWVGAGQKVDFFAQKSWFFCNCKHLSQNIMTPCYSYYFFIFYIFHFFQIIVVSLLLARHDMYFIMFQNHSKQSIIIRQFIMLIAITCSRGENKKKNCWSNSLIKSFINIPPKLDDFEKESYITEGVLFHWRIKTGGVLRTGGVLNLGSLNSPLHWDHRRTRDPTRTQGPMRTQDPYYSSY